MSEEDIFFKSNGRLIEQKIIEFILNLKEQGKSYAAIRMYLAAVKSFYKIISNILDSLLIRITRYLRVT